MTDDHVPDHDVDERMRRLVGGSVDRRLGPERPAPRFVMGLRRPRPAWLLPLAVAASVALLLGGTVGVVRLATGGTDHRIAPGQTSSVRSAPTPVPDRSAADPTPSSRATTTRPGHLDGSTSPSGHTSAGASGRPPSSSTSTRDDPPTVQYALQQVGAARVAVPTGWQVQHYGGDHTQDDLWCLLPEGATFDSSRVGTCPITVRQVEPADAGRAIAVDERGGVQGEAGPPCGGSAARRYSVGNAVRDFGARSAEYRFWTIDCPDGSGLRWEQYVVPTDRAYVLYAPHADAAGVQDAVDTVVLRSVLPAQDRPLRLQDYGIVRSISQVAGGVDITLDRVTQANGNNDDPTTYAYFIPAAVLGDYEDHDFEIGKDILVRTDGNTVIAP